MEKRTNKLCGGELITIQDYSESKENSKYDDVKKQIETIKKYAENLKDMGNKCYEDEEKRKLEESMKENKVYIDYLNEIKNKTTISTEDLGLYKDFFKNNSKQIKNMKNYINYIINLDIYIIEKNLHNYMSDKNINSKLIEIAKKMSKIIPINEKDEPLLQLHDRKIIQTRYIFKFNWVYGIETPGSSKIYETYNTNVEEIKSILESILGTKLFKVDFEQPPKLTEIKTKYNKTGDIYIKKPNTFS